ncbi:hypothetical protein ATCC90586_010973 [Pythium insidiosum]|nr:hypothetical protein ATCC90586_010973 [Pythium insidiosum]
MDDTVFIHEGGDLSAEEIEGQMAFIPELPQGDESVKREDIQVALTGGVTEEQADQVRDIVWKRRHLLMGKGNARPPAAKGVVCDIDVGDAKPVAQRCRRVPPQYLQQLSDLVKGLLEAGFVQPSTSSWASPIVIVIKKNGVDIRLCVDYRVVNSLTRLMVYPMPWSLAISVPKSQFGMSRVEYLGHTVSAEGIGAKPKNLDELTRLTFPETIKGIQSFLGSLNYYHRFVEHFAVYAAALYEVTPRDLVLAKTSPGHLATARVAFEVLKKKLAETPILRHFDPERRPIVVIYANDWAVASSLLQENEGSLEPITFCSRVLKQHELKFALAEKEALALLQMLNAQATLLLGRPIKVLTRHSTLAWLMTAKGLQGRLEKWGVMLSPWTIEVERIKKGEDDLTGLVAAAVGPAAKLDEMLQAIRPRKAIRSLDSLVRWVG